MNPLGLSRRQTAEMLGGRSVRHVDRLIAAGKLRARGSGKLRTVDYDSAVEYYNSLPASSPRPLPCQSKATAAAARRRRNSKRRVA